MWGTVTFVLIVAINPAIVEKITSIVPRILHSYLLHTVHKTGEDFIIRWTLCVDSWIIAHARHLQLDQRQSCLVHCHNTGCCSVLQQRPQSLPFWLFVLAGCSLLIFYTDPELHRLNRYVHSTWSPGVHTPRIPSPLHTGSPREAVQASLSIISLVSCHLKPCCLASSCFIVIAVVRTHSCSLWPFKEFLLSYKVAPRAVAVNSVSCMVDENVHGE